MKKLTIIPVLFFLFNSCKNIDLSPDYSGTYLVTMVDEGYKNGKLVGKEQKTGNLTITHGPNQKTVMLHLFKDENGGLIEMKIKLGFFSYSTTTKKNSCEIDEEIKGQINDTQLECTYEGNQKCKDETIVIKTVIKGFKR